MPLDPASKASEPRSSPIDERLRILAPTRYQWTFNGPRASRNSIDRRDFVPLNLISDRLQGFTWLAASPWRRVDLVHAYNRIVLDRRPYVIGFESHLPRAFGLEGTRCFEFLSRDLASPRCHRIIAISEYARRMFERVHAGSPWRDELMAKLSVRFPNVPVPEIPGADPPLGSAPIRLVFVGNHFARKGGCVAVVMAREAHRRGIPLEVDVVSSLEVGGSIWSDPASKSFFAPYLSLLELPNVRWHGKLANDRVLALLQRAHFSVLTTFADTFGYSALESMACGTPVIATRQAALMEFLVDGDNAITLELPLNEDREWRESCPVDRASERFERVFSSEVERLASEALERVVAVVQSNDGYRRMRRSAHASAKRHFDAGDATAYWDDLYASVVEERAVARGLEYARR